MVNKKLIDIIEKNKNTLNAEVDKKMKVVGVIHDRENKSPAWRKALDEADDARAYNFAYLRSDRLRQHSKGPKDSGFWIDLPHFAEDLAPSAIVAALEGVSDDDLKKIIADLIVFNRGLIDSAIDLIGAHQKSGGRITISPSGKKVKASDLQDHFRYCPDKNAEYHSGSPRRSISHSLNKLFIFSETRQADTLEAKQRPHKGQHHPPSADTLKKRLQRWLLGHWESQHQRWPSQDAFITRMKQIAPPQKSETMECVSESEIKSWLTTKKKKISRKNK